MEDAFYIRATDSTADDAVRALSWVSQDQQARTARFCRCVALQGFLIIATGQFDKERELWTPVADISWHSGATAHESHIIKDSWGSVPMELRG
jgi:hypothetical protein